jgi:hypothetical protein
MATFCLPSYCGEGGYGVFPLAVARKRGFGDTYDHRFWAIQLVSGNDLALVGQKQHGCREAKG